MPAGEDCGSYLFGYDDSEKGDKDPKVFMASMPEKSREVDYENGLKLNGKYLPTFPNGGIAYFDVSSEDETSVPLEDKYVSERATQKRPPQYHSWRLCYVLIDTQNLEFLNELNSESEISLDLVDNNIIHLTVTP